MAAGQGFKTFTVGEVLTASDTNGYLMQGILVFASEAARNSAITSPQEGQFAFTKDNNSTWYYDGAAWVASGASGDVTGIAVTDPTGPVPTVTNSMATAIDAKGDLVVGTGADTFSRLAVGANDTVLTADSTAGTGLKWAAAGASGGMTLISTTALSGTSTTISSIPGTYVGLVALIDKVVFSANAELTVGLTSSTNIYNTLITNATLSGSNAQAKVRSGTSGLWPTGVVFQLFNYTSTGGAHTGQFYYGDSYGGSVNTTFFSSFSSTAITSLVFSSQAGTSTFSSGSVKLYGVK